MVLGIVSLLANLKRYVQVIPYYYEGTGVWAIFLVSSRRSRPSFFSLAMTVIKTDWMNEQMNPPSRSLFMVISLRRLESRPSKGLEKWWEQLTLHLPEIDELKRRSR